MAEIANIGILTAFVAGIISFLSPCVLPLVPGYISYVAGQSLNNAPPPDRAGSRLSILALSVSFVLGFSTVFIALGASATVLGQLLLSYRYEANLIGGTLVMLFGLFMMGILKASWFHRDLRFHAPLQGGHPASAYLLGLAFAFGWTPCIGPVLGAILTVSAVSSSVSNGIALLTVYSLGLGVPFLMAAMFMGGFINRLKTIRRMGRPLQITTGFIMVIMGIAMITGQLSAFSYWLLETFPDLARMG